MQFVLNEGSHYASAGAMHSHASHAPLANSIASIPSPSPGFDTSKSNSNTNPNKSAKYSTYNQRELLYTPPTSYPGGMGSQKTGSYSMHFRAL